MRAVTIRAADEAINSLLQWGIGGIILAVFVAPTFWLMVRGAQKREEARAKREEDEATASRLREEAETTIRREREKQLVDALTRSVEQQREALAQWRQFEAQEEKVHTAILAALTNLTNLLTAQQRAADSTASSQTQIAHLLGEVANRLQHVKAA